MLDLAEQAFFGGEDGAFSVDVDGAAFKDDARVVVHGTDFFYVGDGGHEGADFLVVGDIGIFGPGGEAEVEGEDTLRG